MLLKRLLSGIGAGLLVPFGINICPAAEISQSKWETKYEPAISRVIEAIRQVESSNQSHPQGHNDGGAARGWYQIHRSYWIDGTGYLGVAWDWSDSHDLDRSTLVVRAYLTRYGKLYEKIHHKTPTEKEFALMHNLGGQNYEGWKTRAGMEYWRKVQRNLQRPSSL